MGRGNGGSCLPGLPFPLLQLGDVVVGEHASAIGQSDTLVANDAAIHEVVLKGGHVSLVDFLDSCCHVGVEFRIRHIIDVVVPVVVDDIGYRGARFDELVGDAPDMP
ncbi:MAG: hypothetical protein EWM72_03342 [Nitrospira sp.]|nr:MAG: hypothetical protein EWM72_03342 [Nitrospira sp.]